MSNLKKMVRARMAETGESYTAALRHVRAQAPQPRVPSPSIEVPKVLTCDYCNEAVWSTALDEHCARPSL